MNVFWGILESGCLSVHPFVHVSMCPSVYNILVSVKVLMGVLTFYSIDTHFDVSTIDSI